MRFVEFLLFNEVTTVGYQDIQEKKLFGPVYHGTTEESINQILQTGFRITIGGAREGDIAHGYELQNYGHFDIPAPVHHLGYGVYFTQSQSIAKNFSGGRGKLLQFYLDAPRIETINFGSANTMMKWWRQNGYDMPSLSSLQGQGKIEIEKIRIQSTKNMTDNLKSKYDAILYKGKGLRTLLDGNQVCIYDPKRIYLFDKNLNAADQFLVGDRVKLKGLNASVIIRGSRQIESRFVDDLWDTTLNYQSKALYVVTLKKEDALKIKELYRHQLLQTIITNPKFNYLLSTRMENGNFDSKEAAAENLVDYYVSKSRLEINFPEALLEKKIGRGERIK